MAPQLRELVLEHMPYQKESRGSSLVHRRRPRPHLRPHHRQVRINVIFQINFLNHQIVISISKFKSTNEIA